MFRNLTFFRFPSNLGGTDPVAFATFWDDYMADGRAAVERRPSHIEESLQAQALKPVGPMELSSRGFVSPYGIHGTAFVQRVGNAALVTVGGEDKLLPAAVVNDLLQKKLDEIEKQEGRRPGGRARQRIKADIVAELLPRAFVEPSRLDAYFDLDRNFIAIDTASRRGAESVVSEVRHAIGSFPALPLNAQVAPRAVLTAWLAGDPLPNGLSLGDECEFKDPSDSGAKAKLAGIELGSEEVQKHLEAGMQCTRLALQLDDCVSFVLGEDLVVRKLKLLDAAADKLELCDRDDLAAELDARFALLVGEVGRLFDLLAAAFKISSVDPDNEAAQEQVKHDKRARTARAKPMHGIETITIQTPGRAAVTVTPGQLLKVANITEKLGEVAAWIRATGKTSISGLQRELMCGYNEAARIIEMLENAGVVSPPDRDGKRTVITKEST